MLLYAVPFTCERSRTSYAIRKTLNVKRYTLYAGDDPLSGRAEPVHPGVRESA
jgi:hypothetical protein